MSYTMDGRGRMTIDRPSHPYIQCWDGASRVFTDRADIACSLAPSVK